MGKGIMFMIYMWLAVSIAGGISMGNTTTVAATTLTADISATDTTINVESTEGFPDTGFIEIDDERIGYIRFENIRSIIPTTFPKMKLIER